MDTFDFSFYKGKKVLVTGHTGFKGSWLCRLLLKLGAEVTGYALEPPTQPDLFQLLDVESQMHSVTGDIRDLEKMKQVFAEAQPEIVLHLAAQPIVRESYKNPVYTYETNVMGTVNIQEAVRQCKSVKSFLNVTTDKVYRNNEWEWGYRETDELDGYDPYSNSKSCSELVTHSYEKAFLKELGIAVSTARAGNVIGGGDFAADRIADLFCEAWGEGASWENLCQGGPHEANFLKLDCSRIRSTFGWKPHWQVKEAISQTVKWYQAWLDGDDMAAFTDRQIEEYLTQNR